jgi:hypothetical protein
MGQLHHMDVMESIAANSILRSARDHCYAKNVKTGTATVSISREQSEASSQLSDHKLPTLILPTKPNTMLQVPTVNLLRQTALLRTIF